MNEQPVPAETSSIEKGNASSTDAIEIASSDDEAPEKATAAVTKPTTGAKRAKRAKKESETKNTTKILKRAAAAASVKPEKISLKEILECTVSSNLNGGGYKSFIAKLTEKGRRDALQLCKGQEKVWLCLICVDEGCDMSDCLFKDMSGGNLTRHFERHGRDGEMTPEGTRTMVRITELVGVTVGPLAHTTLAPDIDGNLTVAKETTGKRDMTEAITRFIHEQALPFEVTSSQALRQLLHVAKKLRCMDDIDVSPTATKKFSLEMMKDYRTDLAKVFRDFRPLGRVHLMHDGWESNGKKYLGVSVAFVAVSASGLKFVLRPIALKRLDVDFRTGMIQSDDILLKTLEAAIGEVGLRKELIASLKSDNAANSVSCSFLELKNPSSLFGYRKFMALIPEVFDDWNQERQQGCLSHTLALAVTYAVGLKEFATEGEEATDKSGPPAEIAVVLELARRQTRFLRTPKMRSALRAFAIQKNMKAYIPAAENATRWWSTQKMLRSVILNTPAMELFNLSKSDCSISQEDLTLIQQVHAILEPLVDVTMKLSQISSKPIGPATLPLIYFTLDFYGVDLSRGLFASELNLAEGYERKVKLSVLQPDGHRESMFLENFKEEAKEFFRDLVKNLIYRLHEKRGNKFFYEIVGMLVDPVMKFFAKSILPSDDHVLFSSWTFAAAKRWTVSALQAVRDAQPSSNAGASKISSVSELDDGEGSNVAPTNRFKLDDDGDTEERTAASVTQELCAFLKEKPEAIRPFVRDGEIHMNLTGFSKLLELYDPLTYWSPKTDEHGPAQRFPTVFNLNLTTLGYISSSAFQESVFSAGKRVLTDDRTRLGDDLAEACVVLHASQSLKRSEVVYTEETDEGDEG